MTRMCVYRGHDTAGQPCPRKARKGWTTCARHHSAGRAVTRQYAADCRVCGGEGYVGDSTNPYDNVCPYCKGTGVEDR